jgi:hypothetical protein
VLATQIPASKSPPFSRPGTVVPASSLGVRVFVSSKDGFALANLTRGGGATYPVATVNGGRTWRIDGPEFHVNAANGPDVVTQVGGAAPSLYFAYGGPDGSGSVVVSADGGHHWWRAYLGGDVFAVVSFVTGPRTNELVAFTDWPGAYYSKDGGQVWHYDRTELSF